MKKLVIAAVLLLFAGMSFAQTLDGGVVLIHEIKHSMDDEALKKFMKEYDEKLIPLILEHFADAKQFKWVKGIGTDNKGDLAVLIYYESLEDFRKYYGEDGNPTEKGAAAYGVIMPVWEEMAPKYGELSFVIRDWYIKP